MSVSKIEIKVGIVEFAGEGDQEWLAQQFDKILIKVPELLKIEMESPVNSNSAETFKANSNNGGVLDMSMLSIASKLGGKAGSDLATAAAAYLKFVQGKNSFSREDILKSMKLATGYFKGTMVNNFTKILTQLVKNNAFAQAS